MIVHSFDTFGEVRRLDPATGALTPTEASDRRSSDTVHGHYGLLGDTLVLLYRSGPSLLLHIGGTVVAVDGSTSIGHERVGDRGVLEVAETATGAVAAHLDYALPEPVVAPEDDPTPFAEAEDFDFGLFIANVANDARRRTSIYGGAEG